MVYRVFMPKVGMSMETGVINKWLKKVGDHVEKGEPLIEIESDKVDMEIEANDTGYLVKITHEEGDTVPVIETIGYIATSMDEPIPNEGTDKIQADCPAQSPVSTPIKDMEAEYDVIVIGGGPAGITAALMLREEGIDVTIFDKNEKLGGVLRYGIPEFRLDRSYIDQYDRLIEEAGVTFKGNVNVGGNGDGDISLQELAASYDAVLIAGGAAIPRRLDIPGEDIPDIIYALDYLKSPDSYTLGHKVLVIGGGNVTMDACRTANRKGHDTYVYYRKSYENMPANSAEVKEAIEEGVKFHIFEVPVAIRDHKAVMRKCENVTGADGRISTKMIDGTDHEVEFDSMLVAISANVDLGIFGGQENIKIERGWPVTDELQQTSMPGVFLAGDFILGPATVVEAVASAKKAVKGILKHLGF